MSVTYEEYLQAHNTAHANAEATPMSRKTWDGYPAKRVLIGILADWYKSEPAQPKKVDEVVGYGEVW